MNFRDALRTRSFSFVELSREQVGWQRMVRVAAAAKSLHPDSWRRAKLRDKS